MIFLIFFGIVVIAGQPYWPRFICLYYFLKFFWHRRHCRSALLTRLRFVMIFLIFSASASLLYWPGFVCYDFFDFFRHWRHSRSALLATLHLSLLFFKIF